MLIKGTVFSHNLNLQFIHALPFDWQVQMLKCKCLGESQNNGKRNISKLLITAWHLMTFKLIQIFFQVFFFSHFTPFLRRNQPIKNFFSRSKCIETFLFQPSPAAVNPYLNILLDLSNEHFPFSVRTHLIFSPQEAVVPKCLKQSLAQECHKKIPYMFSFSD